MLRLRRLPRAAFASAPASRLPLAPPRPLYQHQQHQQHQQQRLLWSRTADLMSWMGLKQKPAAQAAAAAAVEKSEADENENDGEQEERSGDEEENEENGDENDEAAAPPPPSRKRRVVAAGALEVDVGASGVRDMKRASQALQRHVYAAKDDATRLLALWTTARSFRPFVLEDGAAREWVAPVAAAAVDASAGDEEKEEAEAGSSANETRPQVLQLLPLDAYVDVTRSVQSLEIGSPGCFSGRRRAASDEPERVVFVGEKTLLRLVVRALAGCSDEAAHRAGTQLFEAYEAERRAAVDELLASARADDALTREQLEDWTRLSKDTYAAHIDQLVALREHRRVIAFFETPGHVAQFLGAAQTLRKLLKACLAEARGDVARRAVDDFHALFPWLVLSRNSYQMAMQASFKSPGRRKTPEQLADALHVFTLLRGAGYVVYPTIWSALFNACVYAERQDEAVACFATYAAQQIAPFEHRFTQALRTACKQGQLATAVAMVDAWVAIEEAAKATARAAAASSILDNQAARQERARASRAECECFNKVLWEMLKREPTLAQLTHVLRAMQQRRAPAGAQVIRLLVPRFLRAADDGGASDAAAAPADRVQRVLALWDEVPSVLERNAFVVHLLLDACVAGGWERECEQLVAFAVAHQIDLPMGSLEKLLAAWEAGGDAHRIAEFGHALLRDLDAPARARLSQGFFELFLTSFLRAQRFADVLALDAELQLTARFPKSDVLRMVVEDARSA